jgi:AcrR family transcriptional regulator
VTTTERLPAGRHGLTRDQVRESQRSRMQRAMAEEVAANGYASTPVAAVLKRAGVSRETFYQHFANKEECFLSAYDSAATIVLGAMVDAPLESPSAAERLSGVLARYLAVLASEPAIARTFMVEVYAAGPAALERRVAVQARFAEAVTALLGARTTQQRFDCHTLVAAVIGLVTEQICAGETEHLEALHGPVMRFAQAPLAAIGIGG